MKFRPCIDIHNGKVKQIIGDTLGEESLRENYVSEKGGDYYARLYKEDGLKGGHVIMLNPPFSRNREVTKKEALKALKAYPMGLQIGGGITEKNAVFYLENGASHVIVTSYVFEQGKLSLKKLKRLKSAIGKERIVIDLSCRKKQNDYYVVMDRWQRFTEEKVNPRLLYMLADYCDEFLIHGVDVEGKGNGMEKELLRLLSGDFAPAITYAGGIASLDDIETFRRLTGGRIDFTIGSALDLFGGKLSYNQVINSL